MQPPFASDTSVCKPQWILAAANSAYSFHQEVGANFPSPKTRAGPVAGSDPQTVADVGP